MKISILTLFPRMFEGPLTESILKMAVEKKLLEIEFVDIRTFGLGRHKTVDDKPYGGGAGMLFRVDVLKAALDSSKCSQKCDERVILLDPKGKTYSQEKAQKLSEFKHLILVCPHYEGVDERFKKFADEELSIGDYILTGGEIPAMVVIDSVARLIPGVLGKEESNRDESFGKHPEGKLLEYSQYTRPDEFEGIRVPKVLVSGDHKKISVWKKEKAIEQTKNKRPDLLGSKTK